MHRVFARFRSSEQVALGRFFSCVSREHVGMVSKRLGTIPNFVSDRFMTGS